MPNQCCSILEITGPENEIKSIADTELDFEKILPTPLGLISETDEDCETTEFQKQSNTATYEYADWYHWRLANWGVKWNPTNVKFTVQDPNTINVRMNTAWEIPFELLKKLSKDHPNTTIQIVDCEDEGGHFVGSCKISTEKLSRITFTNQQKRNYENGVCCVVMRVRWSHSSFQRF